MGGGEGERGGGGGGGGGGEQTNPVCLGKGVLWSVMTP